MWKGSKVAMIEWQSTWLVVEALQPGCWWGRPQRTECGRFYRAARGSCAPRGRVTSEKVTSSVSAYLRPRGGMVSPLLGAPPDPVEGRDGVGGGLRTARERRVQQRRAAQTRAPARKTRSASAQARARRGGSADGQQWSAGRHADCMRRLGWPALRPLDGYEGRLKVAHWFIMIMMCPMHGAAGVACNRGVVGCTSSAPHLPLYSFVTSLPAFLPRQAKS